MNKKHFSLSAKTNLALFLGLIIGYLSHWGYLMLVPAAWGGCLLTLSLYGLSGSITNSLAITMIFEKIPFVWGSGIIEQNFALFQQKLKETLMEHLFQHGFDLKHLDVELVADKLYEQLQYSELAMVTRFITPAALTELLKQMGLAQLISESVPSEALDHFLSEQIHKLSPADVKALILKILDEHLEWLIVWGAAFGVAIGIASLFLIGPH